MHVARGGAILFRTTVFTEMPQERRLCELLEFLRYTLQIQPGGIPLGPNAVNTVLTYRLQRRKPHIRCRRTAFRIEYASMNV